MVMAGAVSISFIVKAKMALLQLKPERHFNIPSP